METPDLIDDEVIADSEEENDPNLTMDCNMNFLGNGVNHASSVSAFTTAGYPQLKPFSAISDFTGNTPARLPHRDNLSENDGGESNQRRPGQADTSVSSISNAFTDIEGMSILGNIAERAKMRQRTQKKTFADTSDVIELTSEDEYDEIGLKPSISKSRPTPKPKPKPKPKSKQNAKEISSKDAGTPNLGTKASLPPKPRPRPIPISRRPKPPQDAAPATSTPGPELPIATYPPCMPLPNQRVTSHLDSQLPSSDPPMSTFRTEYSKENEPALPRIETLPKVAPDGPLSSPSSLFDDAGTRLKKLHGQSRDSDAEIDELAPSDEGPVGYYQSERSLLLRKMPPPPTFFAGSSSSPTDREGAGNILLSGRDPRSDIIDLTDLPPTMVPPTKSKPSSETKKSKEKSSEYDEYDDINAPLLILDQDEQDDDFYPSGDGEKKKKKAKAKENKAKSKAKAKEPKAHPNSAQVEVIITTKPPKAKPKNKTDAKTKGKEKESVKGDKEVFKSREFIEDSDDDDPLQLVEGSSISHDPRTSSGPAAQGKDKPQETDTTSSSDKLTIRIPAVQLTSALLDTVEPSSPLSDLDMPKSKSSRKNATGTKKRKSIIDSDHEKELEDVVKDKTPSNSKKRKTDGSGSKKEKFFSDSKGKAKQTVMSDEEESFDMDTEETSLQVQVNDAGRKKTSKIVDKEEGNQSDNEDPKVFQQENTSKPRDVDKSAKENTAPPISKPPVVATPKPSKPIPLNNDGTTPVYARYEIAPRRSSLPMSELIRRANSMPGSPFATPNTTSASASASSSKSTKLKPLLARTPSSTAYSPYLKSSRSLLSKIVPLHPNRKTPPPPPPPPPPRKKSKKELELEAKWEEEMVEEAGGMEAWAALQDEERKEMRKMKWAREIGGWDD